MACGLLTMRLMNHFIKGKVFLLILVLAGGGLLLTFVGVVNNQQTRQLIAKGKDREGPGPPLSNVPPDKGER